MKMILMIAPILRRFENDKSEYERERGSEREGEREIKREREREDDLMVMFCANVVV